MKQDTSLHNFTFIAANRDRGLLDVPTSPSYIDLPYHIAGKWPDVLDHSKGHEEAFKIWLEGLIGAEARLVSKLGP